MRIDHTPAQALVPQHQPHHPPHHAIGGDFPGAGNHVMNAKDTSYRLLQAETDDSTATNRDMCPMRIGSKVDGFERKGQAWFVATELQSDLVVEVGDMSFHLHKFPLLSRSGKLNRLVFDSRDTENSHIKLEDMPGGPETFELAAKFCYGVAVELTSANVAALRCAAEYLEMTEDLDEGNLVSKTEAFLSFVVLASWKDSVTVLRSCEKLLPWADQLQVARRCCESIAWKACTDPRGIRWSFTERPEQKKPIHASPLWNGPKNQQQGGPLISDQVPNDWWVEDICVVGVNFFTKIIQAIKVKGMRFDLIGSAVVHYAIKWLPGLTREFVVLGNKDNNLDPAFVDVSLMAFGGHPPHSPAAIKDTDQVRTSDLAAVQARTRELIETLSGSIPTPKDSVPCKFLLRLLRLAKMVSVNSAVITDLEKRAGQQLDQGTLSDLLIPTFDQSCDTLFDVDLVQRMLDCFLLQDFMSSPGTLSPVESDKEKLGLNSTVDKIQAGPHSNYPAKMRVAKLIDNYLAEVGRDQNLTLHKFLALAEALPENTRATDDGLYKAIDTYLKAHPVLSEHERKKLCRTLDCQRLSLDACMHAAQNERLPLRVVVQVLFGEQIKLRNAVTGTNNLSKDPSGKYAAEDDQISIGASSHESILQDDHVIEAEHSEEEIKILRSDVERMKGKFMALQHDYTAIQLQLEKLTKHPRSHSSAPGWKKLLPHFQVPHFISHPMDVFHHGHHHHHHHGHEHDHGNHGHHGHHGHQHPEKDREHHVVKDESRHHHHHHHHVKNSKPEPHHCGYNSKEHRESHHHQKDRHESHHQDDHHESHHQKNRHESHQPKDHHNHVSHHQKEHLESHHLKDHYDSRHQRLHQMDHHQSHHHKDHYESHQKEHHPHHSKEHDARHSKDAHRNHHLPPRDSSYPLTLFKPSTNHRYSEDHEVHGIHPKDHSSHSKELPHYAPNPAGHHPHPQQAAPPPSKDGDSNNSGSHADSGEDSSRSLEGPGTPTHTAEEQKKHAKPFASAIRKWRNSIS